jgi:LacI family transcriptional regulator, galactose operon repressor
LSVPPEEQDAQMPPPTIRDVAALAGVSLKTVSRVINSEVGVSPATTARVSAAISELGFQRNDLARSLRQGHRSSTLGLVIEDVANPFYSAIVQAVEHAASKRGYMLITASCEEDPERERERVQSLLRRRVDALLLVPASGDHSYLARETTGTPIVFLDRPPGGIDADQVLLDNVGGATAATEHLLAQGHERIAFVGDRLALYTTGERLSGYRAALSRAGMPVHDELVRTGGHDASEAEHVVAELLSRPPELRPTAGLTVIRHDSHRMGALAAELAFERLAEPELAPRRIIVPTELVARGSGEVPPS